jgi:hypothetical protein
MRTYLIVFVFFALIVSCSNEKEGVGCVDSPNKPAPVAIELVQLQNKIPTIRSKQELVALLSHNTTLRDQFLRRSEYPNDSAFINTLYQRFTNPYFDSLLIETNRVFGDLSELKREFEEAFTNLHHYYPEIVIPKIQTVITGLDGDLYVSDTLIIVGLDYYLGIGAKYRPNMYGYILRQYIPQNIVPSVMLLYGIDERINISDVGNKTVLAEMMAYGKSYYFAKHMLPCKADSVLMNYSTKEITDSYKNQDLIWYRFVEDKVLYATGSQVKQHFLGDRPKTIEVGPECPGRIGQWVGWQIINSYMKNHPEASLQELMQMSDANKLFKESKYKANRK